jgi:hypothetical protein
MKSEGLITVLTVQSYWMLSWGRFIQFTISYPISLWPMLTSPTYVDVSCLRVFWPKYFKNILSTNSRNIPHWAHHPVNKFAWRSRYSDWIRAGRPRGQSSSPGRGKNFLFSTSFRPVLGPTQPPIQWVPWALSPWVKRYGREADHSPPASAAVKKILNYTSIPPYAFIT